MLVTIFADASFNHKLVTAAWGCWIKSDRGCDQFGAAFINVPPKSSSEAEVLGAVNSIRRALASGIAILGDRLIVQLDCDHANRILNGLGAGSFNEKLAIDDLKNLINRAGVSVEFRHVKAHENSVNKRSYCNEVADKIAKEYRRQLDVEIESGKRIWAVEATKSKNNPKGSESAFKTHKHLKKWVVGLKLLKVKSGETFFTKELGSLAFSVQAMHGYGLIRMLNGVKGTESAEYIITRKGYHLIKHCPE